MLPPWTQTVVLEWRAELRFHEVRVALLRAFEDEGILRAFRIGDEAIDARVFDQHQVLSITQSSLTLQLLRPDADREQAWEAVVQALAMICPRAPQRVSIAFQHISPIEDSFGSSVRRSLDELFAFPELESVEARDWALLLDLAASGESAPSGQAEVGVAQEHELPYRLARLVGRISGFHGAGITPDYWEDITFPKVAFFADTHWRQDVSGATDLLETAWLYWDDVLPRTDRFVVQLRQKIGEAAETEGGTT